MTMKVSKQQIYEKAVYASLRYSETGMDEFLIESAVTAGVYYGCGGRKKINIHSHYLIIVMVTSAITKAKEKFSNNNIRNIEVINESLSEQTGGAIRIERINNIKSSSIAINIIRTDNNDRHTIVIPQNRITDEVLCRIAQVIMSIYSNSGMETPNRQVLFNNNLITMLKLVG